MVVIVAPVGLGGKDGAGLHRLAVHVDRAGPAMRGFAADMRAGDVQLLAQHMDQKLARFGKVVLASPLTVSWMCIFLAWLSPRSGARPARAMARPMTMPATWRLEVDGAAVVAPSG